MRFKIGDLIKDIEDSDCFYQGVITSLNPLMYKITNIVWCGEIDTSMNGFEIEPKWWKLELD